MIAVVVVVENKQIDHFVECSKNKRLDLN